MPPTKPAISANEESLILHLVRNKWIQSGLAGVPFVGGPIQSFLSNVVTEIDKKNWQRYWQSVEARLDDMDETKIDLSYFSSEDFVLRIRRIYSQVVGGVDDTKLEYLRNYLVACASHSMPDTTWKDIFLRYLQDMTGAHLVVLKVFHSRQQNFSHRDRFELPQRIENSPIALPDLLTALGSTDTIVVELLTADLSSHGLIERWTGAPIEPIAWSITDSGIKLIEFLTI